MSQQPGSKQRSVGWMTFFGLVFYVAVIRMLPYIRDYYQWSFDFGIRIPGFGLAYPYNFSPLMAVSLFGGACLSSRWSSLVLPVLILMISDLGIWLFSGHPEYVFHSAAPLVYLGFTLGAVFGWILRSNFGCWRAIGLGLAAEVAFFLITNFGSWLMYAGFEQPAGIMSYDRSFSGLLVCYELGLPFFKYSLASTLVFVPILFVPMLWTRDAEDRVRPFRKTWSTLRTQPVQVHVEK